jgi:N-methylhydantoinase B/oxoprolinase/acetone carboxylase alpha subunit
VEEMENDLPVLIPLSNHWTDSCGHGKYRGGVGTVQMWVTHHVPALYFMAISDNSKIQTPQPLFGGYAPSTVPGVSVRGADIMEKLAHGDGEFTLDADDILEGQKIGGDWENEFFGRSVRPYNLGDIITFGFATGGAGYGDPLDRDPDLVIQDLKDKIVSAWSAEHVYKVKYDADTMRLDEEATAAARDDERKARLARGVRYEDFEAEWLANPIDESLLKFYGTWPDAAPTAPVYRP